MAQSESTAPRERSQRTEKSQVQKYTSNRGGFKLRNEINLGKKTPAIF